MTDGRTFAISISRVSVVMRGKKRLLKLFMSLTSPKCKYSQV